MSEVRSRTRPRMVAERYGGWDSEAKMLGPGQRPEAEDDESLNTSPKILTT